MMDEYEITCDDEHRYRVRVDNKLQEVPSVTTIMNDVGYYPWLFTFRDRDNDEKMEMLNAAAKRGTAVHQITEDLDHGKDLPDKMAPELEPYVQAYIKFKSQNDIEITEIEKFVFNLEWWYAGALDRVMTINGTPAIVDLKTGQPADTTGIQLAAYLLAYEKMGGKSGLARFGLYLRKNGTYKLIPYRNTDDLPNFLAAVRVFRFKKRK